MGKRYARRVRGARSVDHSSTKTTAEHKTLKMRQDPKAFDRIKHPRVNLKWVLGFRRMKLSELIPHSEHML